MGNCNSRAETQAPSVLQSRTQFTFLCPVGKGGFGRVWKVQLTRSRQTFAMKEMQKGRVVLKRSVNSVMNERRLLAKLRHPFIVNMHAAFQDRENLYLVIDYMAGGDIRHHLGKQRKFSEAQSKFFIACMLAALEYLHGNQVMHRDLKPENLVLDDRGYLRVTDFGISRMCKVNNAQDNSGTPGYMAPEVMTRLNHTMAVDYYAVGVMAFEFMNGRRPYAGHARNDIREAILAKQVQIARENIPEGWSVESADFINQLIQRKPGDRLGFNGPKEVMAHPWLANFPWKQLLSKQLDPPFKPPSGDNFDTKVVTSEWKEDDDAVTIALQKASANSYFEDYFYDPQGRKPLPETPPISLTLPS